MDLNQLIHRLLGTDMATLLEVYRLLFPEHGNPFARAPLLPADLFAFTAYLMERSGAYYHVAPVVHPHDTGIYRELLIDDASRADALELGRKWREGTPLPGQKLPPVPPEITHQWAVLRKFQHVDVFEPIKDTAAAPAWWALCIKLMMIADEASKDIGFHGISPFASPADIGYAAANPVRYVHKAPFSLSTAAEDLVCVQPKSRTPMVGCTLRSLTHHLALLPPRGQVRARWVKSLVPRAGDADDNLGLLLIPFPYDIDDRAFVPAGLHATGGWGWFDAKPTWLPEENEGAKRGDFVDFVKQLISKARAAGRRVDGVVLPELALDYPLFVALGEALADANIDFLMSGIHTDAHERPGNFVAVAPFFLIPDHDRAREWKEVILVREKHHRWRLERSQIESYGFGSLDPNRLWWEKLTILSRSLDVLVYRGRSTLTTLICEDLARVDPCQAVIRAIGPNLLVALLMDGPQIAQRWPARYATVLAEDPGTSVLSFSSFGLIARHNRRCIAGYVNRSVALWKDEQTGIHNLELRDGSDALSLTLKLEPTTEHTLDGRSDGGAAHRWVLIDHVQIAGEPGQKPAWVENGLGRT